MPDLDCRRARLPLPASMLTAMLLLASVAGGARTARAQVVEPNGTSVPGPTSGATEISLQNYFDTNMEMINAVTNAAAEPGVFLPLCDFQATLVLSQSSAQAGIAWYNVPAAPTGAPPTVTMIVPPGTPVGQVINSADVRSNPAYAQGLIGFALMRDGAAVYYSEYQRNALCSGCTMPGYWKMALAYQSRRFPNTYYLAFEDWPGADQMSWQGNDGDFNDKVFRINGVTCEGGGEPCDTTKPGVCSTGITECQAGGKIICKQQVMESAEKCDNLDNDCDGQIDNGSNLCQAGFTCVKGTCIPPCGSEFECAAGLVCTNTGLCVEPACVDKACPAGQVCRAGACVGGCDGVTCPLGQECQLGFCVDLCANVQCPGAVCLRGVCVTHCRCAGCDVGKACVQSTGACVDTGCQTITCPMGQVCRMGACMDACTGAVCPGAAACRGGVCDMPMTGRAAGGAGGSMSSGSGGAPGGTGGVSGGTGGTLASTGGVSGVTGGVSGATGGAPVGTGGVNGPGGAGAPRDAGPDAPATGGKNGNGVMSGTCGCAAVPGPFGRAGMAALGLALLALRRRRG